MATQMGIAACVSQIEIWLLEPNRMGRNTTTQVAVPAVTGQTEAAARTAIEGAGLGLYLSQRIVRSHGSELTVQTRLGEGSVFGFDLEMVQ